MNSETPRTFRDAYEAFWGARREHERDLSRRLEGVLDTLREVGWVRPCLSTVRRKDVDSLWQKHVRECAKHGVKPDEAYDEAFKMEDLLGGKIVVLNLCDVVSAAEITQQRFADADGSLPCEFVASKDHFTRPTQGGHRAIHQYYKVEDVPVEVQVLTELTDFWTRWDHFLRDKPKNESPITAFERRFFGTVARRLHAFEPLVTPRRGRSPAV